MHMRSRIPRFDHGDCTGSLARVAILGGREPAVMERERAKNRRRERGCQPIKGDCPGK
jgi:hypothetical protein